jgi:hypothetical protein
MPGRFSCIEQQSASLRNMRTSTCSHQWPDYLCGVHVGHIEIRSGLCGIRWIVGWSQAQTLTVTTPQGIAPKYADDHPSFVQIGDNFHVVVPLG